MPRGTARKEVIPDKDEGQARSDMIWGLVLIFVVSWNLRTVIALIGSGASHIEESLRGGSALLGAISTAFVLAAALAAPIALWGIKRLSVWTLTVIALILICTAQVILVMTEPWGIWAAVVIAGLGSGTVGAVIPAIVGAIVPQRVGVGIAVFMIGGSAGFYAASLLVPVTVQTGRSWTAAAIPLVVLAGAILVVWLLAPGTEPLRTRNGHNTKGTRNKEGPSPTWLKLLIGYLAFQSIAVFGQIAWVVPTLEHVGLTPTQSGTYLGLLSGLQVVSGIGLPVIAQRLQSMRFDIAGLLLLVSALLILLGALVLTLLVLRNGPAVWTAPAIVLLALGHGGAFAMANFMVATKAPSSAVAVRSGGLMMLWSQLAGALGPILFGTVKDQTGDFKTSWLIFVAMGTCQLLLALLIWRSNLSSRMHCAKTQNL